MLGQLVNINSAIEQPAVDTVDVAYCRRCRDNAFEPLTHGCPFLLEARSQESGVRSLIPTPDSSDRETGDRSLNAGDAMDLIHDQATDIARLGSFNRSNHVIGASDCVSTRHPRQ